MGILRLLWALFYLSVGIDTVLSSATHRIAFGSCSNPARGGKIWRLIESFHPSHLVLLGDTMYVDREAIGRVDAQTPWRIDREYGTLTSDRHWQSLLRSVEYWSTVYDDHDYGQNNGDKNFIYKEYSQQAFKTFAKEALPGVDTEARDGVYSAKTIHTKLGASGDIDFSYKLIMLDIRTHKDPSGTVNGDFLGPEQWQWLVDELADPLPDLVLIGTPIQALVDDSIVEEKWGDFPQSRARLLGLLTAVAQRTNVIILSGDVHRAEVSRASCTLSANVSDSASAITRAEEAVKAEFLELTSSGLSHTITQITHDTAEGSSVNRTSTSSTDSVPEGGLFIPVQSRLWLVRLANEIYRAVYPGHYREHGLADVYYEINFGLLDLAADETVAEGREGGEGGDRGPALRAEFAIVSHRGERVIQKSVPLRSRRQREAQEQQQQQGEGGLARLSVSALDAQLRSGKATVECVPYWGLVPLWRQAVYRGGIALALLGLVLAPLVAILWLVGASIYYICWGKELARRNAVEARYQDYEKKKA